MSPQNSTGSTQDSDSWASSHSSDCHVLTDNGRSRNTVARGTVDNSLLVSCPAFPTSFYDVRPQQTKRKKPPAKKLILEQEVEKRVPLSAGKSFGAEQDGVKELAALEGQLPPVKEQLSEPSLNPAGDPQPNSLLEELMKEEKDWMHGEQGTEKPVDDPQLKEHDPCSGGRKNPSSCSTLDQSEGEDASRGSSQLSGECPREHRGPCCAAASDEYCASLSWSHPCWLQGGLVDGPSLSQQGEYLWDLGGLKSRGQGAGLPFGSCILQKERYRPETCLKWGVGLPWSSGLYFFSLFFFSPPFCNFSSRIRSSSQHQSRR